jgi:Na+/phosphate symporter
MTTLREQIDKHMTGFPGSLWDCIEYYADENVVGTQRQSFIEAALKELESLLTTHAEQEVAELGDYMRKGLKTVSYHCTTKDAAKAIEMMGNLITNGIAARKQGKGDES